MDPAVDGEIVAIQKDELYQLSSYPLYDGLALVGNQLVPFNATSDSLAGCLSNYILSKSRARVVFGRNKIGNATLLGIGP